MEFYMKKAAQEEWLKQPKQSKDEMPPPASLQSSNFDCDSSRKKGHHMGDYIPPEELEMFLASCNDMAAQKAAREATEKAKIQADNVGHKLLSKMGWKEGEDLGSSRSGISDPVLVGNVKKDNLGVGTEQYKKRMMLECCHRPILWTIHSRLIIEHHRDRGSLMSGLLWENAAFSKLDEVV